VFDRDELTAIAQVAQEHDLLVVADEVYEHLTFDGVEHVPIATLPGMWERTVTIGSAGKSFSFTGWKVGWATGPAALVAAVRTAKQFLTYVASGPFQYAAAVGLGLPDEYFVEFRDDLQRKRDLLASGLERVGFEVFRPQGTYFITADISSFGPEDGMTFCRSLPDRCGVVAIPNVVFYDDVDAGRPLVRFAFCKRIEVLQEAVDRLSSLRDQPA
jgi:N-succinyldiaminopimelate aminotransferase